MAKTQEELNTLKTEYETVTNKLKELTDEELGYVTGGSGIANSTDGLVEKRLYQRFGFPSTYAYVKEILAGNVYYYLGEIKEDGKVYSIKVSNKVLTIEKFVTVFNSSVSLSGEYWVD